MTDSLKPTQPLRAVLDDQGDLATRPIHPSDAATNQFAPSGEPVGERSFRRQREADIRRSVPGYEITSILGRGGMGVVYKARQTRADRAVALKMVLAGRLANDEELDRFRAEALAAAALDHPGIVPIYEVGEHEGQPFFSMGYVDGPTLAARLAEGPLGPREAAAIVGEIAAAVEYAHSRGVVHRDLKPGNVLLKQRSGATTANSPTANGGVGQSLHDFQPVVTDFGLAKRVGIDSAARTVTGQVLGTPSFMPPEQAQGRVDDVGPRADVYALGALLYACLVGRPPFQAGSVMETLRQVVEQEPIRPRDLDGGIPLDLETIALKCLEKEPLRRYGTAGAVADELRRYLAGEPITARPIGRVARVWRWCKRKPAFASAAAITLLATIATIVVLAVAVTLVKESEGRALQLGEKNAKLAKEEGAAKEQAQIAAGELGRKNEELRRQIRIAQATRLTSESKSIASEFPVRSLLLAREAVLATSELEYPVRAAAETALRDALARLPGWAVFNDRFHMTMSPNGRWLAVASDGGAVRLCDLTTAGRQPEFRVLRGHAKEIYALQFTADSQRLVTVSIDKTVRIWDMAASDPAASCRVLQGHKSNITCLSLSGDGRWLATGSNDNTARVWDLAAADLSTAVRVLRKQLGKVRSVTLSGDARWLATQSRDGVSRLWDLAAVDPEATARVLSQTNGHSVHAADAAGRWLAIGNSAGSVAGDENLVLYDLRAADPIATRRALTGQEARHLVIDMAITPNGRWLVTGGSDATARVYDLNAADPVAVARVLHGHTALIKAVAVSPAARFVATGSVDGTARLYDLNASDLERSTQVFRGHDADVREIALSPDGQRVITSGGDLLLRAWGPAVPGPLGATPLVLPGDEPTTSEPHFSLDGKWLLRSDVSDLLCFDLAAPDPTRTLCALKGHFGRRLTACVLRDGRGVATCDERGTLRLWDLTSPRSKPAMRTIAGDGVLFSAIRNTNDGRWLITHSGRNRVMRVWDTTSADPSATVRVLPETVSGEFAVSSDGRWLATTSDSTAKLWDLQTAGPLAAAREFSGQTDSLLELAFDPQNRWLAISSRDKNGATGSRDRFVRLWNLAAEVSAEPRLLDGQQSSCHELAISPDGRWLVSGGDKEVVVWDLRGAERPTAKLLHGHSRSVSRITFSPDGRWLVTAGRDKTVRVWDLEAAEPGATARLLSGPQNNADALAISPDGRWIAASDEGGVVWLWPLPTSRPLELVPQVAGRELTPAEREQHQVDLPALGDDGGEPSSGGTASANGEILSGGSHAASEHVASSLPSCTWRMPASRDDDVRVWVRLGKGRTAEPIDDSDSLDAVRLDGAAIGDDDLRRFAGLTRLRQLVLTNVPVTDAGLAHLRDLPELESLFIFNAQISGSGLSGLSRLSKLNTLGVGGPLIDDASLQYLPDVPELFHLELANAEITDAGLAQLRKYKRLQILNLSGSRITDAGVDKIVGLGEGGLRELYLEGTAVTAAGRDKLRSVLPNCNVRPTP